MELMTLLGLGAPMTGLLSVAVGRWLVLHARPGLVRAAAELPAGTQVTGCDAAGSWAVHRLGPSPAAGRSR